MAIDVSRAIFLRSRFLVLVSTQAFSIDACIKTYGARCYSGGISFSSCIMVKDEWLSRLIGLWPWFVCRSVVSLHSGLVD